MESIHVKLNEVVLRDGLQLEEKILSIEEKLEIYAALKKAGIQSFEFGAFVHPKRVPQMANSGEFFSRIEKDKAEASLIALIPNLKGAERAREAGVQTVNYVLSISDSHNLQNVQQPTAKSLEDLKEIRWYCGKNGMVLNVSCATTFGCPFEGEIPEERVLEILREIVLLDIPLITLADTTGMAHPKQVHGLMKRILEQFPNQTFNLHFHNTRGMGLANVLAGVKAGVRNFDTALGGIGGCPFAPGATGNVCTEDVVHMLQLMDLETETDLDGLLAASDLLSEAIGHASPSYLMKAGPSTRKYPLPVTQ